jgi:hypothetical protein
MSLARYANRRDATEAEIVKALLRIGAQVKRMNKPCDLLVRYRGHIHVLEVEGGKRTGTGARQPEQVEFLRDWQVPIVKTVDEALAAVNNWSVG